MLVIATRLDKQLHESRLALFIVARVFAQSLFDNLARNPAVSKTLGGRFWPRLKLQYDSQRKEKTTGYPIEHAPRILCRFATTNTSPWSSSSRNPKTTAVNGPFHSERCCKE